MGQSRPWMGVDSLEIRMQNRGPVFQTANSPVPFACRFVLLHLTRAAGRMVGAGEVCPWVRVSP